MIKIYVFHVPKKCKLHVDWLLMFDTLRSGLYVLATPRLMWLPFFYHQMSRFSIPQIYVITLFLPSEIEIESSTDFNTPMPKIVIF